MMNRNQPQLKDNHAQIAQRIERQNAIDAQFVEPVWARQVEVPLVELSMVLPIAPSATLLMPELRFSTLLRLVMECFPPIGKMMIVDSANTRFEFFRQRFKNISQSLYFSAQNLGALNYSDGVFDNVITEMSLSTLIMAPRIFPEYARVMRPGGRMIFAAPLAGSFPAFFDILTECVLKIHPADVHNIPPFPEMTQGAIISRISETGLLLDGQDQARLELSFPDVEKLLFSTLVETFFLSACLSIPFEHVDHRQLLMLVVRAFHHYFQGESVKVPLQIGLFSAVKTA